RLGWGRMSLVRPRYLALLFTAYFGAIGYYAWQAARRAGSIWFEPPISQTVYQTTMVGGVLVLLGLFITASISPHVRGAVPTNSAAAKKVGLDLPELRRLVAEAAAGHDADLAQRVRLVEQVKGTLEAALVERIAESLQSVLIDIERMKAATQQVHAAEMTAAEAVALLDTGNYAAAVDRSARARDTLERQMGPMPRIELATGPSSFVALSGPAFVSVVFVALSSALLPGVGGFLNQAYELNTAAILSLSYGWLGLILYSFLSVYYVL